jgi:hypothetical protein
MAVVRYPSLHESYGRHAHVCMPTFDAVALIERWEASWSSGLERPPPHVQLISLQWVIKKTRLIMISHTLPGYGVAIFDHEAIHIGCSLHSSLLDGVERQKDNDPEDRKHGHIPARCNLDSHGAWSPSIRRKHASGKSAPT